MISPKQVLQMDGFWYPETDAAHTYYVYVLFRPNGRPFYVGKGKNKRIEKHEAEARGTCQCHKCHVIRKIWRKGGEVDRRIVFTTNDERAALVHEAELIQKFRSELVNIMDSDNRLKKPVYTYPKKKRESAKARYRRRAAAAQMAIDNLERKLRRAYFKRDYQEQERLIDTIEAYQFWLKPPDQERLEFE